LPEPACDMDPHNPLALAAELRARALAATAEECAELLFLAAEYERLAHARDPLAQQSPLKVFLPK
jgi:hypothetical protein